MEHGVFVLCVTVDRQVDSSLFEKCLSEKMFEKCLSDKMFAYYNLKEISCISSD